MKARTISTTSLKTILGGDAGIDTNRHHRTHSSRSASSSAAAQMGMSLGWIKSHGHHWSDRSKVWEQVYDHEIVSYCMPRRRVQQ